MFDRTRRSLKKSQLENRTNENALFLAIRSNQWDHCRELLHSNEGFCLALYDYGSGWSTLHEACHQNAPVDIIDAIHSFCPQLIEHKGSGFYPVHCACIRASDEVVEFLLRETPQTLSTMTKDKCMYVPLFEAIDNKRAPSLIKKLLMINLNAVHSTRIFGGTRMTPISHHVNINRYILKTCEMKGSKDISNFKQTLSLLLMAYLHETVEETEFCGKQFLIHDAILYNSSLSNSFVLLIKFLLRTTNLDFARSDKQGNYPMHLACKYWVPTGTNKGTDANVIDSIVQEKF